MCVGFATCSDGDVERLLPYKLPERELFLGVFSADIGVLRLVEGEEFRRFIELTKAGGFVE